MNTYKQDFELHTLESEPESLDIVYDRTRDLIATSGNSALLTISDKPSIASVKAAQLIQSSKSDYLTRQFEDFLNNVLNNYFDLKYQWKVTLWGDIFYHREDTKNAKELFLSGATGLLPRVLSDYGFSIEEYNGAAKYVDILGVKVQTEQQEVAIESTKAGIEQAKIDNELEIDATDDKNSVGRPTLSDDEVENENTAASKDAGTDVSDIKDSYSSKNTDSTDNTDIVKRFSSIFKKELESNNTTCAVCGNELEEDEEFLCDGCLQELYEGRMNILNEMGKMKHQKVQKP